MPDAAPGVASIFPETPAACPPARAVVAFVGDTTGTVAAICDPAVGLLAFWPPDWLLAAFGQAVLLERAAFVVRPTSCRVSV